MTRSVSCFVCNWSRFVELPSSDEMKMFYTEHDFKLILKISSSTRNFIQRSIITTISNCIKFL